MNGIRNENQLTVVKGNEFDNPLFHKLDFLIDNYYRHCLNNYFQTFKLRSIYNINFTNIRNNETKNLPISDERLGFLI